MTEVMSYLQYGVKFLTISFLLAINAYGARVTILSKKQTKAGIHINFMIDEVLQTDSVVVGNYLFTIFDVSKGDTISDLDLEDFDGFAIVFDLRYVTAKTKPEFSCHDFPIELFGEGGKLY